MRLARTAALLPALGLALALLPARAGAADVIFWPSGSRPPMDISLVPAVFDQVPITMAVIKGAGLQIQTSSSGDWGRMSPTSDGCSITFQNLTNTELHLSFAVFEKSEFLPDLEKATWDRYIAGLRARYSDLLTGLTEGGTMDGSHGVFIFGRPYREVVYSWREAPNEPEQARRELFLTVSGKLFVVVVEGNPEAMQRLQRGVDRFLSRLELEE